MEVEGVASLPNGKCGCCESWITHYERHGGLLGPVCAVRACRANACRLAAVRRVASAVAEPSELLFVPVCDSCHRGGQLVLKDDCVPIFAMAGRRDAAAGPSQSVWKWASAARQGQALRPLVWARRGDDLNVRAVGWRSL